MLNKATLIQSMYVYQWIKLISLILFEQSPTNELCQSNNSTRREAYCNYVNVMGTRVYRIRNITLRIKVQCVFALWIWLNILNLIRDEHCVTYRCVSKIALAFGSNHNNKKFY